MASEALLPPADPNPPPTVPELAGKALNVPAELILQLATGMEEPLEVAKRFGFSETEFGALCQWQPFRDQVEAKRAELKQSGHQFRIKMAWMAEDLSADLYTIAKGNEIPYSQKLETFRTMAKLADLEPKPQAQVQQGSGFSITINLDSARTEKTVQVVETVATEIKAES